MKKKITELTQQQEQRLRETYREWLQVGRNTEPINRQAAAEIVTEFYRRLGNRLMDLFTARPAESSGCLCADRSRWCPIHELEPLCDTSKMGTPESVAKREKAIADWLPKYPYLTRDQAMNLHILETSPSAKNNNSSGTGRFLKLLRDTGCTPCELCGQTRPHGQYAEEQRANGGNRSKAAD